MTYDKALNATVFFNMGIAFPLFSLKPNKKVYELICKNASPLKLEVPDYDDLIAERLYGAVMPPKKWFEGPEGDLRRVYFLLTGILFLAMSLGSIKNSYYENAEIYHQAVRKLSAMFKAASIPLEIYNDLLAYFHADVDNPAKKIINTRKIVEEYYSYLRMCGFFKSLQVSLTDVIVERYTKSEDESTKERLKFSDLESAPSCFTEDTVLAIEHMLKEVCECYKNRCYLATVILCGKCIETLIKTVYEPLTKKDKYKDKEKKIERTFKEMCDDLCATHSRFFDKRMREWLNLIYSYRSGAIHEALWNPGADKAFGIGKFTNDFMDDLFRYINWNVQL